MLRPVWLALSVMSLLLVGPAALAQEKPAPVKWSNAKTATLTITVPLAGKARLDPAKFPPRDFPKKVQEIMNAMGQGDIQKMAQAMERNSYQSLTVDQKKRQVRVTMKLYREAEAKWPRDNEAMDLQVWGARMAPSEGPGLVDFRMMKYDLLLKGKLQADGSVRGKLIGWLDVNSNSTAFTDGEFELKPDR